MAEYAVMPYADYEDACEAVREKTGGTATIKSGDMGAQIRAIDTQEDLTEELSDQDTLIADIMTALEGKAGGSGGSGTAGEWIDVRSLPTTYAAEPDSGATYYMELPANTICVLVCTDGNYSAYYRTNLDSTVTNIYAPVLAGLFIVDGETLYLSITELTTITSIHALPIYAMAS